MDVAGAAARAQSNGAWGRSEMPEATVETPSPPPVEVSEPTGVERDLDQLTDRVYHAFERRMRVERERRGF